MLSKALIVYIHNIPFYHCLVTIFMEMIKKLIICVGNPYFDTTLTSLIRICHEFTKYFCKLTIVTLSKQAKQVKNNMDGFFQIVYINGSISYTKEVIIKLVHKQMSIFNL